MTENMVRTTTAVILATFTLMTAGVVLTSSPVVAAFAQSSDQDSARDIDRETGDVQVAEAKPDLSEENKQGNLISQVERLLGTQGIGGAGGLGGGGGGAGAGLGLSSDASQGQSADDASQGNTGLFGDDLGISTAFNVGQVDVDLSNLVNVAPSSPPAEQ
jgi:hypothetical protein